MFITNDQVFSRSLIKGLAIACDRVFKAASKSQKLTGFLIWAKKPLFTKIKPC